ncbi:MAG: hypothetical protein QOE45_2115 [Frankiaceae bacterium]|jgi:hypothetical protein|nr:hypothetical protein [Frankiaceae bacterium]
MPPAAGPAGAARPGPDADGDALPARAHQRLFRFTLFMALVTAVLTVGSPLIGLRALHSADVLRQFEPWRSDASEAKPQNRILTDVVDVITPMHEDAKRRIADGDYPLSSTYPSGGMPLGSVPSWSVIGPLDLPDMFLPSWYAPGLVKFLELLVALALTYLFLRLVGLGKAAATFGGMLFMNSGFMLISTNWPHAGVTTLVPGVFWGIERTIQRRTLRSALPLALVVAGSLFQGYPSVTGYALFFGGIYAAVRVLAERRDDGERRAAAWWARHVTRGRVLALLGAGVGLGFALAALQLLPFSAQLKDFYIDYRKQNPHRILPLRSLATLAVPDALGSTREDIFYGIRNYAEMQVFIGASAVVVVIAGLARVRRAMMPRGAVVYLAAATVACTWLIYVGRLPLEILQKALPSLFGINFVGRMRSVLGFLLAWVAALCLQAILDRRGSGRRWVDWPVYGAGAAAVVYGYISAWRLAEAAHQTDFLRRHTVVPAIVAVGTVLAVAAGSRLNGRARGTALALIPVLLMVESVTFAREYLPRIDKSEFYPVTATHQYVLDHIGHERIAAADAVMYPGTTTYYGIRSVSAHGFHAKSWHDMLLTAGSRPKERAPTLPLLLPDDKVGESPVLDRLGAKYWVQSPTAIPPGTPVDGRPDAGEVTLRPGVPVEVPVTGPLARLRWVRVGLHATHLTPDERAHLFVEALDATGAVTGDGDRRIFLQSRGAFGITVAEPAKAVTKVRITLRGTARPVTLAADAAGLPSLAFVVGGDDGLREVFAHGSAIYQRLHTLPRVRWAARTAVETDATARLRILKAGLPPDTVLLSASGPAPSGAPGAVTIERDTGDDLRLRVDARGSGYVVVADAMQSGWHAKVDGRSVPLVAADHAGVGVFVPAGTHTLTYTYIPSGWRTGVAVSFLAALLILGVALRIPRYVMRRLRPAADEEPR